MPDAATLAAARSEAKRLLGYRSLGILDADDLAQEATIAIWLAGVSPGLVRHRLRLDFRHAVRTVCGYRNQTERVRVAKRPGRLPAGVAAGRDDRGRSDARDALRTILGLLTDRQRAILQLRARSATPAGIAAALGLSEWTVFAELRAIRATAAG
jgi:DNA-directed RNA polymerase specialized sigma24 family protein